MKTNDLINAFGDVEEKYIAEASANFAKTSDSAVDLDGKPKKIGIAKEPIHIRARRTAFTAAAVACALAVGTTAGMYIRSSRITYDPNSALLGSSEYSAPMDLTPITSEHKYYTLDEIRAMADAAALSNDRLSIEKVRIGSGDIMPVFKASPYNKNLDKATTLVKHLFGEDFSFEEPNYEYFPAADDYPPDNCISFYNNNHNPAFGDSRIVYHENGLMFLDSANTASRYAVDFASEKHYKLYMGDKLDDSVYKMKDGLEWSVADAAAYAEEFANTFFSPLENNEFTFGITDIRVKNLDGAGYGYTFEMQRVDRNGNLYDNHKSYANRTDSWLAEGNPWLFESKVEITFYEKETPHTFWKSEAPYSGGALNSGGKLISLQSAIDIVSSAEPVISDLPPSTDGKLEFATAELEYYYVSTGCPEYTDSDYSGSLSNYYYKMMESDYAQLRPYWAFTLASNYREIKGQDGSVVIDCEPYSLYLVDAVTGALHVI